MYIESTRGEKILLFGGYRYRRKYTTKNGISAYWRCADMCGGGIHLDYTGYKVLRMNVHKYNCTQDKIGNELAFAMNTAKKKMKISGDCYSKIYYDVFQPFIDNGHRDRIPKLKNFKKIMLDTKKKVNSDIY